VRLIVVSGGVLAIAAIFGLGVVVGRFVLKDDRTVVSAPTNAIMGPSGVDNPLGDPNAALAGDPAASALPPAAPSALPPARPPQGIVSTVGAATALSARSESDAAMEASAITASCNVRVSKDIAIRSWSQKDRISVVAIGPTCDTASIRLMLETSEGAALYSLQTPARDLGILAGDTEETVRTRLAQLLPTDSVRAAAFPQWTPDTPSPNRSEFTQESYEAVRTANNPVTCLKFPTTNQRCVAGDLASGQIKVFSRS
jgi:hypothetical protein